MEEDDKAVAADADAGSCSPSSSLDTSWASLRADLERATSSWASRDNDAEVMRRMLSARQQREAERSSLLSSLTEDIGGVHEELAACRRALHTAEEQRDREADFARQREAQRDEAQRRLAVAEEEIARLRETLEAERASRSSVEGVQAHLLQSQQAQAPRPARG